MTMEMEQRLNERLRELSEAFLPVGQPRAQGLLYVAAITDDHSGLSVLAMIRATGDADATQRLEEWHRATYHCALDRQRNTVQIWLLDLPRELGVEHIG